MKSKMIGILIEFFNLSIRLSFMTQISIIGSANFQLIDFVSCLRNKAHWKVPNWKFSFDKISLTSFS